jgi:hypothetical protein
LGKNCDIKGLELVGAFGGKCKDEDIVFICNSPELISLMRIMTIEEEKDGGVIYLMCLGKWDESLLKPFEAKFIVGPSIG